ncbi:MAG TPA: sensor histidine kinase [Nitrososphaeraceae archaeon]
MYNKESNNHNLNTMNKKFSDALFEFISSVESELDIMLPHPASLHFLFQSKIFDHLISQKLSKNIVTRILSTYDESTIALIKKIVPFIGYKSIKPSSNAIAAIPSASLLVLIRDKQDIFCFSFDIRQYGKENINDTILSVNDWLYSRNVALVKNTVYCFDVIWREKDNYDEILKEKKHSDLLVDLITHDIRNYHQIIQTSLGLVISLFKKNKTSVLSPASKRIFSLLTTAENALVRSQSFVDNVRRLERLYTQKNLKLVSKNVPDAINNAYSMVERTLYNNNPHGKKVSLSMVHGDNTWEINIMAEDLLVDIFINLFSNTIKYTDQSEVKIDVTIKDYFIGEAKYWMVTISDNGNGIPDPMKKELFERYYSKARGAGLGLSIVRALVERYSGKIWIGDRVYNDHTQGTTFGMIFPAAL